jgi:hypothetical protein
VLVVDVDALDSRESIAVTATHLVVDDGRVVPEIGAEYLPHLHAHLSPQCRSVVIPALGDADCTDRFDRLRATGIKGSPFGQGHVGELLMQLVSDMITAPGVLVVHKLAVLISHHGAIGADYAALLRDLEIHEKSRGSRQAKEQSQEERKELCVVHGR